MSQDDDRAEAADDRRFQEDSLAEFDFASENDRAEYGRVLRLLTTDQSSPLVVDNGGQAVIPFDLIDAQGQDRDDLDGHGLAALITGSDGSTKWAVCFEHEEEGGRWHDVPDDHDAASFFATAMAAAAAIDSDD